MKEQALALLGLEKFDDPSQLAAGICLYEESWHQGVVGIVASRIKDRLNRPVIAFASAGDGWIKGSARSINGIHIRDLLSDLATRHPHLLSKFGGHAMAAGLSLKMEDFCEFSQLFSTMVAARSKGLDGEPVIYTDGGLEVSEMTLDFAELLQRVAPWGHGFPEPVFQGDFEVLESRVLKNQHVKFSLCLPGKDQVFDGIAFFVECPEAWLELDRIRLAYRLDVNEFRNVRRVQLMIEHMQVLKSPA
jgi:single-stranded-DNA-specific exonuclease